MKDFHKVYLRDNVDFQNTHHPTVDLSFKSLQANFPCVVFTFHKYFLRLELSVEFSHRLTTSCTRENQSIFFLNTKRTNDINVATNLNKTNETKNRFVCHLKRFLNITIILFYQILLFIHRLITFSR